MDTRIKLAALLLAVALAGCNNDGTNEKEAAAYLERSSAYEDQGQYRAAMIELRNAIQAAPENIENIIHYAEVLIKIGAVNQASDLLEPLAGSEHAIVLAEAYLKRGKHVSAQQALDKADSTSHRSEDAGTLAAQIKFLRGEQSQALTELRDIAAQGNARATKTLIPLLIATQKTTEAQDWVKQSLLATPKDGDYLLYNAQLAYLKGDLPLAEAQLNEVLLNSSETDILINPKLAAIELLTRVLTDLGKTTESLVYNRILQNENPEAFSARQQYKEAIKSASSGDLEAAKGAFEDILAQFPNNQQAALLLGLVNLEQGDVELGEALLSENIDAEIAPVTLIQATAIAQAEVGKTEEALAVVERALLARPDDAGLLALFGVIALNADKTNEGVTALSKALQITPEKSRLHLLLAQHYVRADQTELALGHLRKSFAIAPTDWPTTSYYISVLFNADEKSEVQTVKANLSMNHNNSTAANWLIALINHKSGELKTAQTQLNKLYKENPKNNQIAGSYASLLADLEQYDSAANVWLTALNNDPGNRNYLERAVQMKSRASDRQQTIAWLAEQKNSFTEATLPIDAGIVQLLVTNNQADKALEIAAGYRSNQQPMANQLRLTALIGSAVMSAQQQDFSQGLLYANQGLAIEPSNQQLTMLAAQFESRTNSPVAALVKLEQFIDRYEDHFLVANDKAKLLIAMEKEQEALEFLAGIWAKSPKAAIANTYLSLTKKHAPDNYENAVAELLNSDPENPGGNLVQGDILLADGKDELAKVHYLKALAANENLVPALNNVAWITAKTNPAEAVQYSQKASELSPQSSSVLDTHGWVLYLNGEKAQAIEFLEKALSLEPNNKAIAEHLAEAKQ